ncbi:MAG: hypothetical protein IPQ06_05955 [Chitinophagaceae bacterium]|nr:hypothetical protein [Chitinophagaceae bacterium]
MNIDRHNYEEYFILYMDNELSRDDRRMVEAFVLQHPDLKEELDVLLQFKLTPDTQIVFEGKEELMKANLPAGQASGVTPLSLSNYEEWLVLYMDHELTPGQKKTVEQFITINPSIRAEYNLLQRTKLQQEQVIFANKESLYRKAENSDNNRTRIGPFRWWRLAAAVLILALGLTTVIVLNNKPSGTKGSEVATIPANRTIPTVQPGKNDFVSGTTEKNAPVNNPVATTDLKHDITPVIKETVNNTVAVKQKNTVTKNQLPKNVLPETIKNEPVIAQTTEKPTNNLPVPLNNPNINKNDASNNTVASVQVPKEITNPKNTSANVAVTNEPATPSNIIQASYPGDQADLDQSSGKKNKLRGFFRKVTRTFEKRTNIDATDDDNKLLVAGLAIKLK